MEADARLGVLEHHPCLEVFMDNPIGTVLAYRSAVPALDCEERVQ